jgi:hypothetical protein
MEHENSRLVFQLWIPEAAVYQPSLARGVLSMSAFHLAQKKPSDKYLWMRLAIKNQTIASAAMRQNLGSINDSNRPGMFILSIFLGLTSFTATSWLKFPSVADMTECFMLLRGPTDITKAPEGELDFSSQFWPLIMGYNVIDKCSAEVLPHTINEQVKKVDAIIRNTNLSETNRHILIETLASLKALYREVVHTKGTANGNPSLIWKWPGLVSAQYVTLLRELEPLALIIFAHFAILTNIFRASWCFNGWAEKTIAVITFHLSLPLRKMIDWPRQQLRCNLEAFRDSGSHSLSSSISN